MKGLNKIALVAAIAAAPLASHAGMKALDDTTMGNVTGQAGVTIELETRVSIGEFTYTDEGTFAVTDIEIGGANASGLLGNETDGYTAVDGFATQGLLLDDLKIDIDVAADGDAVIHVGSITGAPIDWGMQAGAMSLRAADGSESTTLLSNLKGYGLLGALDIRVDTEDASAQLGGTGDGSLNIDTAFTVNSMEFDAPFLAVGVRGMSITGAGVNFDYDGDGLSLAEGDTEEVISADVSVAPGDLANLSKEQKVALGFANVNLDVYKGNGLGASTATDVLRVDVNDVIMDVNINEVLIGGANIGTIGIDNLHISDTRLAVYGKD